MANPEHLKILEQGVEAWNRWREENPEVVPDLEQSDLVGADLKNVNLSGADLSGADLYIADLRHADLHGSNLAGARLMGVELSQANLSQANLSAADLRAESVVARLSFTDLSGADLFDTFFSAVDLRHADLSGAILQRTVFAKVDLSTVKGLESTVHRGRSSISTDTLMCSRGQIPATFLRGCGLSDWEIKNAKLFNPGLTSSQRTDITYTMLAMMESGGAFDLFSAFISYSHEDKHFTRRLHDQLQARAIRCWLDEHDLKPGDRILDVVDEAIRLHDKILLCCSESSLESWWVKDEIRKAQERERREGRDIIIPLMVDRYLLDGWEDGLAADLRSRLAADFTGWEIDNAKFEEQSERVVRALRTNKGAPEQ